MAVSSEVVQWHRVSEVPPPEGVPVRTLTDTGMESVLKRNGNLWWLPDGSMYVYFRPVFWLPLPAEGADRE